MGYLPDFDNDLFISYRHVSNESRDKWVDEFCERLQAMLTELVGDVTIWRQMDRGGRREPGAALGSQTPVQSCYQACRT